jgi:hypothetical protein
LEYSEFKLFVFAAIDIQAEIEHEQLRRARSGQGLSRLPNALWKGALTMVRNVRQAIPRSKPAEGAFGK